MGKRSPGKPETDYPSIFLALFDYQNQVTTESKVTTEAKDRSKNKHKGERIVTQNRLNWKMKRWKT